MDFYINEYVKVAKRLNNAKRNYLLVNLFQAKHIPSDPNKTLDMFDKLGSLVKKNIKEDSLLIIGFAETATAISMHVSSYFDNCFYIQTTREYPLNEEDFLFFTENHSHAVEQKLYEKNLSKAVNSISAILIIDDEISTGNTIINLINALDNKYGLKDKKLYVASLLNRKGALNQEAFDSKNINNICLMQEECNDFNYLHNYEYFEPKMLKDATSTNTPIHKVNLIDNPRFGFNLGSFFKDFNYSLDELLPSLKIQGQRVVVIGTEECMYPAIKLAKMIKDKYDLDVKCHSSSRSPISLSTQKDYPLFNGYIVHSAYDVERTTYIYDINEYDTAIILTDSWTDKSSFYDDMINILKKYGCSHIEIVEGYYDK